MNRFKVGDVVRGISTRQRENVPWFKWLNTEPVETVLALTTDNTCIVTTGEYGHGTRPDGSGWHHSYWKKVPCSDNEPM